MMDAQLVALLTETVQIAQVTGRDQYGAETLGAPTSVACRIVAQDRTVRGAARGGGAGGEEHHSDTVILFEAAEGLSPDLSSRYTLPDGSTRAPLRTLAPKTETGEVDHYEVWL